MAVESSYIRQSTNTLRRATLLGAAGVGALVLAACTPKVRRDDRALELDGRGYVEFPDQGDRFDLVPGGERTFAVWLRYLGGQFHAVILDKQRNPRGGVGYAIFVNVFSGTLGLAADGGTVVDPSGYTTLGTAGSRLINDRAWHYVAIVQTDTLVRGYVDGRLDLELSLSGLLPGIANDGDLWLGWNGRDIVRFKGELDELSVWDRALSARQIRQLMYRSPARDARGLIAYWPMDGTDGDVVADAGPHGINGLAHDTRWVPATRPLMPPFDQTLPFDVLMVVLGFAALYGLMRLYGLRLQRQKARLERRVTERTAELEEAQREAARAFTALEALAGRLAELDEAKNRFFGNLSHQFRTPLSLIIGHLSDLRQGRVGPLRAPVDERVAAALRNSRRLLRLTEQLLDLARLESGALQLQVGRVDLVVLIGGLAHAFRRAAERRAIHLTRELPPGPLWVWGDSHRLEIVLTNLLSNALKFTPGGGSVAISARADEDRALVTVEDTGPGIPAEELTRIFERFYQTEVGSRQGEGSGIGLALVQELVALHGGTVEVASTEGSGTTFTVSLRRGRDHFADAPDTSALHHEGPPLDMEPPAGEMSRAHDPDEQTDQDETEQPVVLVVDDSAEIRAYVRSHLEHAYRIAEAADGNQALTQAREGPPDLIVSDLMMPGMDGVELVRALRQDPELSFVPVILLTARAELDSRLRGLEAGADDYLAKPFEPAELLVRIRNLIALRHRLRERLRRAAPVEDAAGGEGKGKRLEPRLRAIIEAHLGDAAFDIPTLARQLAMDRTTLFRHMVEEIGTAPSDFVREVRLTRAAELLANEENSVIEVAYAVGYGSVSSFSRRFSERFGCAPGAYARQARSQS